MGSQRLHGKVAIVTGAGQGIGRGVAMALAEDGASVVIAGRTLSKCRAVAEEIASRHEVGDRWVAMAIRYDDVYRKVDDTWYFSLRKERHWYAADVTERPQQVDFDSWQPTPARPNLPWSATWQNFWDGVDTSSITAHPVS